MTRKRALWLALFLVLTAVTIFVQINSQDFSFPGFWECCKNSDPWLLLAAFLCMLGIIVCEGLSLRMICSSLGYHRPVFHGLVFCAADLFFSAITPSASGGQPVAAYCMYTDDIPMEVASVALLLNLILYKVAMFLVSLLCIVLRPGIFAEFHTASLVLLIFGTVIQAGLAALLLLLLFRPKLVHSICNWSISLLAKLRLLRRPEEKREKLVLWIESYGDCAASVRGNTAMLVRSFLLNLGQRVCMLLVPVLVFLALSGAKRDWLDIFIGQSHVYLGSNAVPLPGAVGAADWLFVDICGNYFSDPVSFNLLSRGISFYCNVAICGLLTWFWLLRHKKSQSAAVRSHHGKGEKL